MSSIMWPQEDTLSVDLARLILHGEELELPGQSRRGAAEEACLKGEPRSGTTQGTSPLPPSSPAATSPPQAAIAELPPPVNPSRNPTELKPAKPDQPREARCDLAKPNLVGRLTDG
ncbi:hypothetical protein CRG98_046209 [Punica granatum]|uniref:Uncharacterized protein n=1 Tax=Punica granatum TaxID=22663 RepID=A0A2I0HNY5_PUNGR|nr:hypothetical protein CRG98_046209 [Punica granatum]